MGIRKREQKSLKRPRAKVAKQRANDTRDITRPALPPNAAPADPAQLVHNNTYGQLPRFYLDKTIQCRRCGKEEVWTARQQKWWYEVAKGNINSHAVHCRACRTAEKARKATARRVHLEGVARKLQKSTA